MRWFDLQTRSAKILTILEKNSVYSVEELSQRLGVSNRTIQNEINKINEELELAAQVVVNKGEVKLYIYDHRIYTNISKRIKDPESNFDNPQNRVAYIADILVNSRDYILIDDLAFDLNVSRSTLNNDLRLLRSILKEYDLKIQSRTNSGIKIIGKEYDIRRFILENTFDTIYNSNILDEDIDRNFIDIMNRYGVESNSIILIRKYLVLSLDRFLNGFPVGSFSKDRDWLENFKLYSIIKEVSNEILSKYGFKLPIDEEIFLIIPLIGMRTPINIADFEEIIDIDQSVIELVDKIIQTVKNETDISFQFNESLEDFIYHVNFLSNRLEFQMYLENPIKEEIKRKYGFAWSLAERAAEIIEKDTNLKVNEDEIGFLTSYFEIIIKEQKLRRRQQTKILILHLQGGATRRLITYQLKKILSSDIHVDSKTFSPLDIESYKKYDLVIVTGPLDYELNVPVIELDEVVDEKILKQAIDNIQQINASNLIANSKRRSTLLSLLNEDSFRIYDNDLTYEEVLDDMTYDLIEDQIADEKFYERLLERERKASMDFSKELSFPHTIHLAGTKPFVGLGLTPNGLKGKEKLRLIILAGLPEQAEDDLTLVQLYEDILKIGENKKLISQIANLSSYRDLLNYLVIEKKVFD